MNKEQFIENLKELNITLNDKQIKQLDEYCDFLLEYNKHTNLTAIKEKEQVYLKHFYDSLTITKIIDLTTINTLLDVGSGAGFPGMVLKIVYPDLEVTLLDSNNKKIEFLKQLTDKLSINRVNIIHGRAEEICKQYRESFDMVTARAVSNLSELAELCIPLVKIGGYFVPMKGTNQREVIEGKFAIEELGGNIEEKIVFNLPIDNGERTILRVKKVNATPKEYPRRYDKIKNKPLKIRAK